MQQTAATERIAPRTGHRPGRLIRCNALIAVLLAAVAVNTTGQTAPTSDTGFTAVKKQIDDLKRMGLVAKKPQSLYYIVDPALDRKGSASFTPPRSSAVVRPAATGSDKRQPSRQPALRQLALADCGIPKLAAAVTVPNASGDFPAFVAVQSAMDRFFKEFHFGRQAKRSLHEFLRYEGGLRRERTDAIFTVHPRFWVETPAGGKAQEGRLVCELEIRAFRATLSPIESPLATLQELVNLTELELLFQDRARGSVRLMNRGDDPAGAVEAAVFDALRDRIAVNLCLSPACQGALTDVDKKRLDIQGRSIARKR